MAKTLKIDPDTNDLVFDGQGKLQLVSNNDEEVQSTRLLLGTNTGEWFLNTLHGLAYDILQKKVPDKSEIRVALIKALSQDKRFKELLEYDVDFNRATRKLEITFKALFQSGNIVDESVVVAI